MSGDFDVDLFVIGGGQLFAEALPLADTLLLTEIDTDVAGDTRFPDWPREQFVQVRREGEELRVPLLARHGWAQSPGAYPGGRTVRVVSFPERSV